MADSERSRRWNRPVELLLLTGLVVTVAVVAFSGGAAANHDGDGNFTVELPDPEDHEPGNRNASANFLIVNTQDFDVLTDIKAEYPDGVPSRCYNRDTRVFGIDRNNDESGVRTDESAIPYASDTERTRHTVLMEFYNRSSVEPSIGLGAGDQFVVSVETCVWHPEEPGWYQLDGYIKGRTPAGEMESVPFSSHYFYICDCDSESEARERLGPPPSESTPTPTATTPTPTATPTPTTTPTPTPTPTATAEAAADGSTPTATSAATGTAEAAADESTPTATPATTTERTRTESTATAGDGAGFGAVVGVAALVGAAAVALRRRR